MTFTTRFAPSPTGPLHLGHAYSALLAHDMARAEGGRFLLRMEDTDLDRSKPEWDALILEDLRWLGLTWDGPILRQSEHLTRYNESLQPLEDMGLLYPCSCTRADIRAALSAPQEGVAFNVYPGTCRHRRMADRQPGDALRLNLAAALQTGFFEEIGPEPSKAPSRSFRKLRTRPAGSSSDPDPAPGFIEAGPRHTGLHRIHPADALSRIGDVVLSRKGEDIVAYFLASALDDAMQGVTHVIRGEDLFDFTPIQVILQRLLGLPTPVYHHHRLIRDDRGTRLAKRDDARALSKYRAEGATPSDIRRMVGLPNS